MQAHALLLRGQGLLSDVSLSNSALHFQCIFSMAKTFSELRAGDQLAPGILCLNGPGITDEL